MLDRPFYFIIVLWGDRFRNYFLDLCLPTLLSAGNLPSLTTRPRSKILICTRPDDWATMKAAPIFAVLERFVDPIYIEIPPCPPNVSGCVHMGIGHRRGCELAYEAKAYPFVLTPDSIFSDRTIARLQELAIQGVQLVLVPALRFAEEPLFDHLREIGIVPHNRSGVVEPITITNRQLVRVALASMHSETKTYEWDAPYLHSLPSAVWWEVPGEDGIVVHCLSWAPLLFDFTAVPEHDTSVFDNWTFDGDYIYKNLGNIKRVHLVLDSDEIFIASWAPLSDRPHDLSPQPILKRPVIGKWTKKERFHRAFYSGIFDPLKQRIFFEGARWHSKPINTKWAKVERRALWTLLGCVAPPRYNKAIASLGYLRGTPSTQLFGSESDIVAAKNVAQIPFRAVPELSQVRSIANRVWRTAVRLSFFLIPKISQIVLPLSRFALTLSRAMLKLYQFLLKIVEMIRSVARVILFPVRAILHLFRIAFNCWINRRVIIRRFSQILQRNDDAWQRVRWRIRHVGYQLIGRQFRDVEPRRPS